MFLMSLLFEVWFIQLGELSGFHKMNSRLELLLSLLIQVIVLHHSFDVSTDVFVVVEITEIDLF